MRIGAQDCLARMSTRKDRCSHKHPSDRPPRIPSTQDKCLNRICEQNGSCRPEQRLRAAVFFPVSRWMATNRESHLSIRRYVPLLRILQGYIIYGNSGNLYLQAPRAEGEPRNSILVATLRPWASCVALNSAHRWRSCRQ